jgi:hypothetical protein
MRKSAVLAALALAAAVAPAANASTTRTTPRFSLTARITSFHATRTGAVANGTLTANLRSGTKVSRDSAPVRFAVAAQRSGGRCNIITLRLAPLDLELLGVQVQTSHISLDVTAVRGRVLGNLFCALARAKVVFPRTARVAHALNARLQGHSMTVFAGSMSLPARAAQTPQSCQVLKLVLGPLHLDLLGLVVDLYGRTTADPVVVTINAIPSQGVLGQLLCGLAGGGVTSVASLQSLLSSLGVNLTTTQVQNLLNQLGITNLSNGLTQLDLNRILQALGLGSTPPSG